MTGPLLLDTHVLLWMLMEPQRIPGPLLERLRDPGTDLIVSAASAWEIGTKHRLGKLDRAAGVVAGYSGHIDRLGARELAIGSRHALAAGTLAWAHRDPFDRMIGAQGLLESLPVVTADRQLADFPGIRVVW